jgi:hypothetical protein
MKGHCDIKGQLGPMTWDEYKIASRMKMVKLWTKGPILYTLNCGWQQPAEDNQIEQWQGAGAKQFILI